MPNQFGSYEFIRLIGKGGMGEVWLARNTRAGRDVAIKVLTTEALNDPELAERFRDECEIAARIRHQHVLPVYDFSVDGTSFIEMPYIDGTDLAAVIKRGPLPPERAVNVVEQVASALDRAHQEGLRHRDVKPSNVLLEPGARPGTDHAWLFDWGIAQLIDTSRASNVTRTKLLVGTPAYIAPERLKQDGTPDHRADIYSLAIVLYECLAGRRPFEGDEMSVLTAHLTERPPPLPDHLPAGLFGVVAKGLAKNPDDRYQTAGEFARAAREVLGGVPAAAPSARRAPWPLIGAVAGLLASLALLLTSLVDGSTMLWVAPTLAIAGGLVGFALGPSAGKQPQIPGPTSATLRLGPGGFPRARR